MDQLLQEFKANPRWLALFHILTPQVERLVQSGSTDPEALHNALEEHNLVSEEELQKLVVKYALEHVRILPFRLLDELTAARNRFRMEP